MSEYTGLYRGAVHDINDPENRGRLRILVPDALGSAPSGWAEPVLPTRSQPNWSVGDRIWVQFEAGDINRPIYMSRLAVEVGDLSEGFIEELELTPGFDAVELANEALEAANEAFNFAQTRNRTFRQDTPPDLATQGPFTAEDIWFDTSNYGNPHTWNATLQQWVPLDVFEPAYNAQEVADNALNEAANAMGYAQSRTKIFRQDYEPDPVVQGPFSLGDTWIDTTINPDTGLPKNIFYSWDPDTETWVTVRDEGIYLAVEEIPNILLENVNLWNAHQEQQAVLANVTVDLSTYDTNLSNLSNTLSELSEDQTALQNRLNGVDQTLANVASDQVELGDHLANVDASMVTLTGDLANLANVQSTLSGDLVTLDGRLDNVAADQVILGGRLTNLDAEMTTLDGNLANLANVQTTLTGDLSALDLRLDGVEADQVELSGRMTNVDATLVVVDGRLTNLTSEQQTLQNNLTENNQTLANVAADQVTLSGTLANLDTELSTLDGTLSNLATDQGLLDSRLDTAEQTLANVVTEQGSITGDLLNLGNDMANLVNTQNTLSGRMDTLDVTLAHVETDQDTLQQQMSNVNTTLTNVEVTLTDLDGTLSNVQTEQQTLANTISLAEDDILATNQRLNPGGDVAQSIYAASVSPVTNDRLTANSLTVWPFANNVIPAGTIGAGDIADFSIVARKLRTSQHIIY